MKKTKRKLFHPAIFIPLLLGLFIVSVVLTKVLLWPAIKLRQAAEHKKTAQEYLENENYRNAFSEVQKAILKNPEDIDSYAIALTASENSNEHHQYIPAYLQRLMEIEPDNPYHFQKYVLLTLRLGATGEAKEVFANYPEAARNTQEYHQLGYSIGSALKDTNLAESHLSKLVELNPEDPTLHFFLSTLQLRSSETDSIRTNAQSSLEDLATTEDGKVPALRVLLSHSIVEKNIEQTKRYVSEIGDMEDLTIIDRLLILLAQKLIDESSFPEEVRNFLKEPIPDSVSIRLTLDFLVRNKMGTLAADWIETLSPESKEAPEVARKISQTYYEIEDWSRLKSSLIETNWGNEDYGRLLLLALTNRKEGDPISFQTNWKQCLVKVGTNQDALKSLFNTISSWGWLEESVEVLEIRFREKPEDEEIFQQLIAYFMSNGETDKAIETLSRRVEFLPEDANSKNNLALLSLISGVNETIAFNFAEENYNKDKTNPYFLTTWAFALAMRDRVNEALPEEQLSDSQRAVYIAYIYLEANKLDTAEAYTAKVDASSLFREEQALLNSTRAAIQEAKN